MNIKQANFHNSFYFKPSQRLAFCAEKEEFSTEELNTTEPIAKEFQAKPSFIQTPKDYDKRTWEKILYLQGIKVNYLSAEAIGSMDDKSYIRALNLIKNGIQPYRAEMLCEEESTYAKAKELTSLGATASQVETICQFDEESYHEFKKSIIKGISPRDALGLKIPTIKNKFNEFKQEGYDEITASILANIISSENLNQEETKALSEIIEIIRKNSGNSQGLSYELSDFCRNQESKELIGLAQYSKAIDFKQLKLDYPLFNKYTSKQLISFLDWHYKNQTEEFNDKTLTFDKDLTQFLEDNYMSAEELSKILNATPLTKKEIGQIPNDWLDKRQDKEEAKEEIYSSIAKFQKNPNPDKFAQDLSQILSKNVQVEIIGQGEYAKVYKISIEDSKAYCIKIFKRTEDTSSFVTHGRNIEPQMGIFLNKHSDNYVKMYFGKIDNEITRNGFLVTQFLDENTLAEKSDKIDAQDYSIEYLDGHSENYIGRTIIDYGGTSIKKQT